MFKKLQSLKPGGKSKEKIRVDLEIVDVTGLPPQIRECRVVWMTSKGMVQLTPSNAVRAGIAKFRGQTMTHVASVTRGKSGGAHVKEFVIKVQAPSAGERIATFCKTTLDFSKYVASTPEPLTQADVIPLTFKVGQPTTGYLKFNVTCTPLGEVAEDGMTEMSGLTSEADQDLDGFEMPPSPTGSMRSIRTSASGRQPGPDRDSLTSAKHEKKGSFQSKFMARLNSLGKESFSSGRFPREESQASSLGDASGAGRSSRPSDSGSGEHALRPAPDFGKKTGSMSSHSSRPPEFSPPAPLDFGKKSGSAASTAGAVGASSSMGLFSSKPPRPAADMYSQEFDPPPKPVPFERPRTKSKKGLMSFMEMDEEEEGEEEAGPPPLRPTSQPQSQATAPAQPLEARSPSVRTSSAPAAAAAPAAPAAATMAAMGAAGAGHAFQAPPATNVPPIGKATGAPGAAAPAGPGPAAPQQARALWQAGLQDRSGATAPAGGALAAGAGARAAAGPGAGVVAGMGVGVAGLAGATEKDRQQAKASKPAAPLAWRGSKAESKIPLPASASPSPSPKVAGQAALEASPAAATAAAGAPSSSLPTAPTGPATATAAQPPPPLPPPATSEMGTAAETGPYRAGSIMLPLAPKVAMAAAPPPAAAAGEEGGASPPAAVATPPTSAAAAARTESGDGEGPRGDAGTGRGARLESMSSVHTTIVRPDSLQSSISSLPEEAVEAAAVVAGEEQREAQQQQQQQDRGSGPPLSGIKTTERRRMQAHESRPQVALASMPQHEQQHQQHQQQPLNLLEVQGDQDGPGPDGAADERVRSLQTTCTKLERQLEAERQAGASAWQQLEIAQREILALRAEQEVYAQQHEQLAAVGELHRRVQEAEMIAAGIKRSNEALTQELHATKQACTRLENMVCEGLNGWNQDQALEAVVCFQEKYEQLVARYQQMETDFMEEADSLVAQLLDAMQQVDELTARVPESASSAAGSTPRTQYIEAPHAHTLRLEAEALRSENDALVQQLVSRQLELAGVLEEKAMLRRDLYRSKEVNLKVVNKMTNLQAQLFSLESGRETTTNGY